MSKDIRNMLSIIIAFRVNISQWPNKTAHTSAVNQNSYVVSEWKVLCKKNNKSLFHL